MSYTEQTKNSASLTNQSKNSSTFTNQFRHGKEPILDDIDHLTFNDSIFEGGDAIKDLTFEELQNQQWTLQNKN